MEEKRNITVELTHEDVLHLVYGITPNDTLANYFSRKNLGNYTGNQWSGITGWEWNSDKLRKYSTEYLYKIYKAVKNDNKYHILENKAKEEEIEF